MKIVYMGTPGFAVPTLKVLHELGHDIVCVVTQPDAPVGRKRILSPPPVKVAAQDLGLDVLQPASINARAARELLAEKQADIAVVLAFGQILRRKTLDLFPMGCINVHGSLLPSYRGAAPIQRAIMAGETQTGVTIMRMDEGLDTGPILLKETLEIGQDDTSGELFDKMAELGAKAMAEALQLIESGKATFIPQPEGGASYAAKLSDVESPIDWNLSAKEIHDKIRGMNPEPGASTCLDCLKIKIWRSEIIMPGRFDSDIDVSVLPPGTIAAVDKSSVTVQTGQGLLRLVEVQPAGGKRMSASDFARGKRLQPCSCTLD